MGGGSFEKQGSTGDLAAELEKGQLPAQDPSSGDVGFFQRFLSSFVPASFIDGLLKILTEKVQSLSTSPREPQKARPL